MPALATPPAAALDLKEMDARPLMENATVIQTAISMATAVKMSTALHVIIMRVMNSKYSTTVTLLSFT